LTSSIELSRGDRSPAERGLQLLQYYEQ